MDRCDAEITVKCIRPGLSMALILNCDNRYHGTDSDAPWLHHDPEFGLDWYREEKNDGSDDSG